MVLFVTYLPATVLQQLIRIKQENGVGIVIVTLSYKSPIPYEEFPMSFDLGDISWNGNRIIMLKLLQEGIINPYFDCFEAIRRIPNVRNTSCFCGMELVWIFKPSSIGVYSYDDHFVQLLVRLEKLLVLDNNQKVASQTVVIQEGEDFRNQKYGRKFHYPHVYYYLYHRFFWRLVSRDRKNNKIFLNIYYGNEENDASYVLNDRRLRVIEMIVDKKHIEKPPRKQDNKIHVNQKDVATDKVVDWILEVLIDISCT